MRTNTQKIRKMSKGNTSYTKAQFKKEFARLMATTSWPDNLPQEDSTKILRELHDFVLPHMGHPYIIDLGIIILI